MANNLGERRYVVQDTETPMSPATHTLSVVGNEVCTVTQQDVRKTVDFRNFTLSRCLPHYQLTAPSQGNVDDLLALFVEEPTKKIMPVVDNTCMKREILRVTQAPMAPALYIPVVLGNEQFVVIQQDIRKEVDIRVFTYSNQLSPVAAAPAAPVNVFGGPVTNLQPIYLQAPPPVSPCTIDPGFLHIQNQKKPGNEVALGPSKNQLCYSTATTTDGLMKSHGCQHCPNSDELRSSCCHTQTSPPDQDPDSQKNVSCQTPPASTSTGCNTSESLQCLGKAEMKEEAKDDGDEDENDEDYPSSGCPPTCTERKLTMQPVSILSNRNCPQQRDRRRCENLRARFYAQDLTELRRQQEQARDTTPQAHSPGDWSSSDYEEQHH